ncbi:nitroreductase family protein [Mycobacterium sp.]|uniref:nitroreductase family protein n=1 Tax=Mycobacterium sp. TaxID=1785 RepID=UPI003C75D5C0
MTSHDGNPTGADAVETLEAMGTARAMRYFLPEPVPNSLVEKVIWAGTRASSANNCQPWDFVVVQAADVRARLGALFAPLASAEVVQSVQEPTARRTVAGAMNLLASLREVPVLIFVCGQNNYPEQAPDPTFMYSAVYAAAQNMVVAARALGLGAAFTTIHRFAEPDVRDILAIPDDRFIAVTIPLGRPARPFGPLTRRPVEDVLHHDRW